MPDQVGFSRSLTTLAADAPLGISSHASSAILYHEHPTIGMAETEMGTDNDILSKAALDGSMD